MSLRLLAGLVLLCALAMPAQAASSWANVANPEFVRIDSRDLPEAAVMTLAQDRAGFLWIGTQGGLARFDGYRYKNFLPDPTDPHALPDGLIHVLLPDAQNGLWIGTATSGLVHYDARSEAFQTLRSHSTQINALVANGAYIWVGGDAGLDVFDPRSGRFAQVVLGRGDQPEVWSVLLDREGTVWAAAQSGLYYRPTQADHFRKFRLSGAVPAPVIYSLYEDSAGRVWAGSVNAVYVIDRSRKQVRAVRTTHESASIAPGQQFSIIETRPGTMWIGTDNAISIVDAASGATRREVPDAQDPGGLPVGRVQQFLRDRSGLIWVANHVGGLLLYNPLSRGMHEISTTRSDIGLYGVGAVDVAAGPGNRLWAGGMRGALVEVDPNHGRLRSLIMSNHAAIQKLIFDRNGTLWIGTTGGLCRLDSGANTAQCPAGPSAIGNEDLFAACGRYKTLGRR